MIIKENYLEQHIRDLQVASKGDPGLIERTLYAFGLLEALAQVGLDFTFKGGTSLLLLLNNPKRLSTDIDIVVDPGTDIDDYIDKASRIFPFVDKDEQHRQGKNSIIKRHFKFTYDSPIKRGPLYILLDVLYERNHYRRIVERKIENELLLTEGENLMVKVPSVDCILGDKMTAFAPFTTGIPIREGKDLEVMKQFYDVGTLVEEFDSIEDVRQTYMEVSETEIGYRGIDCTPFQALEDTIRAAVCIGSRGKSSKEDFASYVRGSRDIVNHIYEPGFSMERAAAMAPMVIYMASCLLTGQPFIRLEDPESLRGENLMQDDLKNLKSFKKVRDDGYAYLVLADRILSKYRS